MGPAIEAGAMDPMHYSRLDSVQAAIHSDPHPILDPTPPDLAQPLAASIQKGKVAGLHPQLEVQV